MYHILAPMGDSKERAERQANHIADLHCVA